nr:MAG TPA: hypothetical protein [Caudoviricetes sp.]
MLPATFYSLFLSSCYNCVLFVNLSSTFVNLNICAC